MKNLKVFFSILVAFFTMVIVIVSCSKNNNSPEVILKVFPTVGSTMTEFNIDMSESNDLEDHVSKLSIRVDWESDGVWDLDWTTEKIHSQIYGTEGDHNIQVEIKDTDGNVTPTSESLKITNSNHLVPANSPFSYNVGINYETWTAGRNNRDIGKDLDTVTKYFKLIKTYHTAAVGTSQVIIDPTMLEVINYMLAHEEAKLELALGTNNNVLANGGYGSPWTPGLMTSKSYTDEWVQMLINSFTSKANVEKYVKLIMLGNEIDANGPLTSDSKFTDYYTKWIPQAFDSLKASLHDAGLKDIPVSTIIANYPLSDPTSKKVQYTSVKYIKDNWSPDWNSGEPLVLFNQYTPDWGKSTDFGPVITYFEGVESELGGSPNVYVGETGYSAEYGEGNEAKVINQVFTWLDSQYKKNKLTVPLFVFMAFDHPAKPPGQKKMGVFNNDSITNVPKGIKNGIKLPAWISKKKN
ncbi:MAG: hypothetical protein CL661_01110 [Bacteroidetes bacterium]|nr:hypothetical protein [Bacteroidota bacterium]